MSGNLVSARRAAHQFTIVGKEAVIPHSECWGRYFEANANLQSYRLDEALPDFQFAVQKRDIIHRIGAIDSHMGLVLTYQAMQRSADAAATMKQLMQFVLDMDDPHQIILAQSCQARLSLLQGDSKPAIDWADSYDVKSHAPSMLVWLDIPLITKARVMIATGSHERLRHASEILETLLQSAKAVHNTYHIIEILVLQCMALEKLGRVDEALEVLQQVIKLAEPGGWVYPFVESGRPMAELLERLANQKGVSDYPRFVLDRFPTDEQQQPGTAAGESRAITGSEVWPAKPLTRRELDVLKLLAQRLQTKEIAARLFVSSETVKSHLKHLYQKLDVYNRRDAAIKAGELLSRRRDAS